MKNIKTKLYLLSQRSKSAVKSLTFPVVGIAAIIAFAASPIFFGIASASTGQIEPRSIEMSSDASSATSVSYLVSYTPSAAETILGIVVDFCSVDPIPNDTCTFPSGLALGSTPTVSVPANITATTWTWTNLAGGQAAVGTITSGSGSYTSGTVSFTISGITNPSATNTTFYARIFDFALAAGATHYASTNDTDSGTYVIDDDGGVAITTSNTVVITSRVQESITFCLYTGSACTGGSICLGTSSPICLLSAITPYVDGSFSYELSTNAANTTTIRMQGNTLTSGANVIAFDPTISGSCSAATTACVGNPTAAQFGLCVKNSAANITIPSNYGSGTCTGASTGSGNYGTANFGFNIANASGTYGDTIATATAGALASDTLYFLGSVASNTLPGVYTTTLTFIATASY